MSAPARMRVTEFVVIVSQRMGGSGQFMVMFGKAKVQVIEHVKAIF